MKNVVRLCVFLLGLTLVAPPAMAAFPERPVTVVVGFAPGGAGDIIARSVSVELEKVLGQPIVVVNKGGRGGALAIGDALTKPTDGYTIIATISSALTLDTLTSKTRYTLDDFTMLGMTGIYQEGFFCMAEKPWKTMREMIEWAKKEKKPLSYPSSVVFDKIITKYLSKKEGVEFRAVPVQGGANIISNVLGGHTDFGYGGGLQASYVKAGKMRHLASVGGERFRFFPEVPTLAEEGWPQLVFDNYFAFYVPKNVPADIAAKLSEAIVAAGKSPATQLALAEKAGVVPDILDGKESHDRLAESLPRYAKLLDELGKETLDQ